MVKTILYKYQNLLHDSYFGFIYKKIGAVIKKGGKTFKVNSEIEWFINCFQAEKWEEETLTAIDYYSDTEKVYIDIGAWVGPTALYASSNYKRTICFEPDPIAYRRLEENIKLNNLGNKVTLFKKAIFNSTGTTKLGGVAKLGSSVSTTLVNDEQYAKNSKIPGQLGTYEMRTSNIIEVESITFEQAMIEANITPLDIAFIKIDIEGGELYAIPAMKHFLEKNKPNLQLSIHFVFLLEEQIKDILNVLFKIYDKCYDFSNEKKEITLEKILSKKIHTFIFENR